MSKDVIEEVKRVGARGRGARLLGQGLSVAVLAIATWVGVHHLPRSTPPPLFADSGLPAAPAACDDAAWLSIAGPGGSGRVPEVPAKLSPASAEARGTEGTWLERAHAEPAVLDAFLDGEGAGVARDLERSLANPAFGGACAAYGGLAWKRLHAIGELSATRRAVHEDWSGAARLALALARADSDAASQSPTVVAHLVTLANLAASLRLTTGILAAHAKAAREGARQLDLGEPNPLSAIDAALVKLLADLPAAGLPPRRAVAVEYASTRRYVDGAAFAEAGEGAWAGRMHFALLDRAATQRMVDDAFDTWAAGGDLATERGGRGFGYNVVGHEVVAELRARLADIARRISEQRAEIDVLAERFHGSAHGVP